MFTERIDDLRDANPGQHGDGLLLDVDMQHLVHEGEVDHASAGEREPVGGQTRTERAELAAVLVCGGERILEGLDPVRLEEDTGVDLVGAAPVGDVWRSSSSGAYLKGTAFLWSASAGDGKE
jgi:hypothetical protein